LKIITSGLTCNIKSLSEDIASRKLVKLKIIINFCKIKTSTHHFGFIIGPERSWSKRKGIGPEPTRSFEVSKKPLGYLISWNSNLDLSFFRKVWIKVSKPKRGIEYRWSTHPSMRKQNNTIILINLLSIEEKLGRCLNRASRKGREVLFGIESTQCWSRTLIGQIMILCKMENKVRSSNLREGHSPCSNHYPFGLKRALRSDNCKKISIFLDLRN